VIAFLARERTIRLVATRECLGFKPQYSTSRAGRRGGEVAVGLNNYVDLLLAESPPGTPDAWRLTRSNECTVKVHVDYESYFKRLADLFDRTGENDEILMVGYEIKMDEALRPGETLLAVLKKARARKVRVRLLANGGHAPAGLNKAAVAIAVKANIDAKMDEQLVSGRSHHTKAVYVRAGKTSTLFVGGMDVAEGFNKARRVGTWFDTQAEITGRAAELGLLTLEERWASVAGTAFTPNFVPSGSDTHTTVQFCRTIPKADAAAKASGRKYKLAGEFSCWSSLRHAIKNTKNFIYLEDQFFINTREPRPSLDDALEQALRGGARLIVVTARPNQLDWDKNVRNVLFEQLRRGLSNTDKLQVWMFKETQPPPKPHFVHSKTWIFDDKLAVVGSANYWTNSMMGESEFDVSIASTLSTSEFPKAPFAHALRITLWERLMRAAPGAANFKFPRKASAAFVDELAILTGKSTPLERII
jgi:phosphatidylserine/phosphatidylglycerophosphate/cardiolipin synthase-like enzyme